MAKLGRAKVQGSVSIPGSLLLAIVTAILFALVTLVVLKF